MVFAGEIEQSALVRIGFEDDMGAVAAVAAVGSALGDVFFASEGDAPVSAVTGLHMDFGFVDEHGWRA